MNYDPKPGDKWSREGFPPIEVVSVTEKAVRYTYDKETMQVETQLFRQLSEASFRLGAVLRRGKEVFSKDTEDFEV